MTKVKAESLSEELRTVAFSEVLTRAADEIERLKADLALANAVCELMTGKNAADIPITENRRQAIYAWRKFQGGTGG